MDVYNRAHALAQALRDSDVRQKFLAAKQKVAADPGAKEMLDDYQNFIQGLQAKILAGEEISDAEKEKREKLKEVVLLNTLIRDYFEAEQRLGVMIMDIEKIISAAVISEE